jgi:two-component system, cell cycle sensor histidine kinase and response regulator CckA
MVIGMSSLVDKPLRNTRERQVFTEQIRLLYANADVSVCVTVSVVVVFSYLQWRVISHRIVLSWLLYMLVVSSARFVLARRYWRGALVGTKTNAWRAAFTIGAGLSAAGWGSAGILLYPKADLLNQVVLAFVVGGMMLGAASLLAARPEAFLTFIIPSGVPTALRFLLHGDDLHFAMGLLGSIFTIATLIAAWHIYLTVGSSLNLRFENGTLVKDLQVARDRAEQALRDREQYLTLAQSTARLGVWDCDLRTNTTEISEECARLHGLSPDHSRLTEADWHGLIYPDDLERLTVLLGESLEQTHIWDAEFRVVWPDQTMHWLLAKGQVYLEDSGRPVRMAGVSLDITERKHAEAALMESEGRFRNVADTAPVMIWVTDPNKQFTFFNKTWLDFTGRTMEQELGNGWSRGVHPEDLHRCYETFCSSFDARQNFRVECRLRRADGEYRWMLCSGVPRFASDGVFAGYIGSDVDITDLQSEERFRQLAENIDQIFWMLDLGTNKILYVSPAFEKVWGCSSALLYQNRDWLMESVHAEDRDRFIAFLEKGRSGPVEEFYRVVRPDGLVRWIHDRTFLVRDAEGKPYRVAGIAEDITAHRELEEQLRQANKMEAVGRLAGGIAHDFNNLLTVIVGYSRMLLDDTQADDPKRGRLEQILSSANRGSTLTRQLLAFSRQQVLQPKLVNLNHLLTNMNALLRRVIGEHLTIETALHPNVGCINVDPNQLEQVVLNLAANARDAMPNGGQFRIETNMADAADEQTGGSPGRPVKYVRLRISDTGCGMDNRTRERAFEPFFTTKGVGKGTGLGLSTVYGIVRQNQGTIHVSSEPGQGTVFELYFPAVPEEEAAIGPPANPLLKRRATETVLLAEDEPAVRGLVREMLEKLGYTVLEAADGYAALLVAEQSKTTIDLLLTDVIMPLMNGHDLAMRLESIRPGTKVLYMSGYTDDMLAFHGIAQPEIEFIQKPFTAAGLAEKLSGVLSVNKKTRQ